VVLEARLLEDGDLFLGEVELARGSGFHLDGRVLVGESGFPDDDGVVELSHLELVDDG
jgi:hypothetical protein